MLTTKRGLLLLLGLVFLLNLAETTIETEITRRTSLGSELGRRIATAAGQLENGFAFEHHDGASDLLATGYSISYFLLTPLLAGAVALALWRRRELAPFRVFSLAIAFDYWISLPFFLLFPLPERWAHPGSGAILLSDRLSPVLIEAIRPMSGLDNSFPSFHVSLSVVVVLACFLFRLPYRRSVAALGATIVLSTFVLGIHWLPDIVAGLALGVLSILLARRLDLRLTSAHPAPRPAAPAAATTGGVAP